MKPGEQEQDAAPAQTHRRSVGEGDSGTGSDGVKARFLDAWAEEGVSGPQREGPGDPDGQCAQKMRWGTAVGEEHGRSRDSALLHGQVLSG